MKSREVGLSDGLSELIKEVLSASSAERATTLANTIASLDTQETAMLLESLPLEHRHLGWETIPRHKKLDVLLEMRGDPRETLIAATPSEEWSAIFDDIEAEELLELADSLPRILLGQALASMDKQQRQYFVEASQFSDEQIGHWMNHDLLVLPINAKVRDALRFLRRDIPVHVDAIYLVNRVGQFSRAVKLTNIFETPEHLPLVDLAEEDMDVLLAGMEALTAAVMVQKSGYASLPVVDDQQKLLGRIDISEASDLVNEHYERNFMASAGMDEDEDLFSPVYRSAKNRAVWLGINLLTAFAASAFIGLFDATLEQIVALAVLMPVVASMGGIAGSQTLTLVIRGLALGQITQENLWALWRKEMNVGSLNGVIWAIVIGIIASAWFSSYWIGLVIAIAILINIIVAALSGVFIPVILDRFNIDPALSGSVILTTVTDIVGFVVFLGLGTLILL